MKNFLLGATSLILIVGILVFSILFAQTQFNAAFYGMSIEVYVVQSISRLLWLVFCVAVFITLAEKLEV